MSEPLSDTPAPPGNERSVRIVIGENNADLAVTLSVLLDAEADMRCVATASSKRAVLAAVDTHAPNAFILDLSLDDGSSLPLIAELRTRLPPAVIVIFTGHQNDWLNEQCLRAGADAVVIKSGEFEQLTSAVRQAAVRRETLRW